MSTMDEAKAVGLARAGDVDAFAWLVRRHSAAAVRLAAAVCGSSADAEDAAQEAFVKIFYALDRFRPGAPLRPWLMRIVANEARNQHRSGRRRAALAMRGASTTAPPSPAAEDLAVAAAEADAVLAALATLGARDRLVIGYRYFGGLSEREMADALGCRQGTVKSRLARALDRLRPVLAQRGVTISDG
jgi:RNA polymerase sigma-70 factor (ECF subfamily)